MEYLPYCPNYGSQVKENDQFCRKCGKQLNNPPINTISYGFPAKPSTNLTNGIIIGSGLTLLVIGLASVFALNSYYWEQTQSLAAQGLPINLYSSTLNSIIEYIIFGWTSVFFGIYFLALCIPPQLSTTARAIWARTDYIARAGSGLITGGFIFATISAGQAIREFYIPNLSGYQLSLYIFIFSGVLMIVVGATLRTISYLRAIS